VLRKNDEELTDGSAPTILYTVKKVSASAQPAAAAPRILRSQHLTRVVLCVQLSVALGSLKLRNPLEPTRQSWMDSGVRVALVGLPPIPVAIRAGVGSRERVAHLLSVRALAGRVRLLRHVFHARRVDVGKAILTTAARHGY
jgi:hypothetical protein